MNMGNIHLVTGYAGQEHVSSADMASLHAAIFGSAQVVLKRGNNFSASVVTNNQIRVLDGDILMQGRHIRLNEGTYIDLSIENGTQGYMRNDLIVARYTKDSVTGVEDCNLVVIKGTNATSNPKDPTYTSGDIISRNAIKNDMPLYRVPLNGLNVGTLVPLFTVIDNFTQIIDNHKADKNNPHGVTAAQAGAAPAGFGLGATATNISNQNLITAVAGKSGFYIGSKVTNAPSTGGWRFMVQAGSSSSVVFATNSDTSDACKTYVGYFTHSATSITWRKVYTDNNNPTAEDVGAVPTARKVNEKALSSDIALTAADVGATNPNLLRNWYFGNLVDLREGLVVPPTSVLSTCKSYTDPEFTAPASGNTITAYRTVTGTGVNANGVEYVKWVTSGTTYYTQATNALRGYVSGTNASVHSVSGWSAYNGRVFVGDGYITFSSFGTSVSLFSQRPDCQPHFGNYTMSIMLNDGTVHSGTVTFNTHLAQYGELVIKSFTANGATWVLSMRQDNGYYFALHCKTSGEYSLDIKAIKLEYGSAQTLAHLEDGVWKLNEIPNKGIEEVKCVQSTGSASDDYANKTVLHTGNLDVDKIGFVATGSYVGTGTYGEANPNSLTFDRPPKFLAICSSKGLPIFSGSKNFMGMTDALSTEYVDNVCFYCEPNTTWGWSVKAHAKCSEDRKTISWYVDGFDTTYEGDRANAQCNTSGVTYRYFAIY